MTEWVKCKYCGVIRKKGFHIDKGFCKITKRNHIEKDFEEVKKIIINDKCGLNEHI